MRDGVNDAVGTGHMRRHAERLTCTKPREERLGHARRRGLIAATHSQAKGSNPWGIESTTARCCTTTGRDLTRSGRADATGVAVDWAELGEAVALG
jgi:hypothetical protein